MPDTSAEDAEKAASAIFITEHGLTATVAVLFVIAWVFVLASSYVLWKRHRHWENEFYCLVTAVVFYSVYMIDFLVVLPPMYRVNYIALGELQPYPTLLADTHLYLSLIFTSTLLSWTVLWSVKLSLLFLYRRLMKGLPAQLRWWMAVFVYTLITYVYSIVTTFTSCGGPVLMVKDPAMFCARPGDDLTRNLSFYGSFVCDLSTDLLIMILPMRLIWKRQMSLKNKIGVGAIFSVGMFCIFAAIIRLVQINSKTGSTNPNNEWIVLWGAVEATTAVVVGCLPAFRFLRQLSRPTYAYQNSRSGLSRSGHVKMQNLDGSGSRTTDSRRGGLAWAEGGSSEENLAPKGAGITVTTQLESTDAYRDRERSLGV
ncbi:MAG: hypothetical protein M4579_001207 [Chaenotheca gracillima]|nr:MAG: hypothetical protein M4579_001207 [Chaenotheca gracillima]